MKRFLSVPLLLGFFSLAGAQTVIPAGEVYGRWSADGSPYRIAGDIHIPCDSTLHIDPGVMVEFQGHFRLKVMGRLLAMGNVTDTILFTVNDTTGFADPDTSLGGWNGIRIFDISDENDTTRLSYCRIQYGKAVGSDWFRNAGGALYVINYNKVVVSNCLFTRNSAGGPDDQSSAGGAVQLTRADIIIVNCTFIHNRALAGGAIQLHESDPVLRNNLISYNHAIRDGGGISCGGGSNPSFSGDMITQNNTGSHGGGIMLWGPGRATFNDVTVTGNRAHWGGGMGFTGYEAEVINSVISHNHATWLGGGIAADESTLTIRNSTFDNDTSISMAGAIHTWQGTLLVQGCAYNENSSGTGGAMHLYNCHAHIDSCLFDSNEASVDGGALYYTSDSLVFDSLYEVEISHTHFVGNSAARAAGGFSIQQDHTEQALMNVRVDDCKIIDNDARQVAGFRILGCIHGVSFSNSLISGNRSEAWTGGGAFNAGSVGNLYNCVFYDNHGATLEPGASNGGFGVGNGVKANVFNCTFVKNSAGAGGGLYMLRGAQAMVTNSIFRDNLPDQIAMNSVVDSLPCMLMLHYNDIHCGLDSIRLMDTVSMIHFGTGNTDADPLFMDELSGDLHLQDESPVIGVATDSIEIEGMWYFCPEQDIEGNPRPDPPGSKPDMGAYENRNAWPAGLDDHQVNGKGPLDLKAYPNPFSHAITLEFNLTEKSHVTIRVFNMMGAGVSTPVSVWMDPGLQRITWSPEQEGGQLYFIRIRAETAGGETVQETGRIIRCL